MNIEYKISQFYDVGDEEVEKIRLLRNKLIDLFKRNNFLQVRTSTIRDRSYLKGTMIHFSKMFEVRRAKENSLFYLQSDLAMSMAEYVSRIEFPGFLKLIQLGTLFRDRIDKKPNYRREFQQILSSIWGSEEIIYDAELVYLNYKFLKSLNLFKDLYIEVSNLNVFNCIEENLVEKIRFGNGLNELKDTILCYNDRLLIEKCFKNNSFSLEDLKYIISNIKSNEIKIQLSLMLEFYDDLRLVGCEESMIKFSISNLEGSGHYSGLHYRIYCDDVLVADGGRIDDLCERFDSTKNIPGVCMGIGVQMLLGGELKSRNKCIILSTSEYFEQNKHKILNMQNKIKERAFDVSFVCKKRKSWGKLLKSEFYSDCVFLLIDNSCLEIRNVENQSKQDILKIVGDSLKN